MLPILQALVAPLMRAAKDHLDRSRVAIGHRIIIILLSACGGVLLFAAALMGLAVLIGPIWASFVTGLTLIFLAGVLALLWRPAPLQPPKATPTTNPMHPLAEIGFLLGFVIIRNMLRNGR